MSCSKYDGVVIGAGFAGLSAARHLHQAGLSFVILEALDRVGGRAKTVKTATGQIELGAQWFHGTSGNPVYDYAVS
jgi:monoamine oxidase